MFKRNVAQSTNYSNSSIGSNLIKTKQMIHNENGLDLCEDENRCKILEKYILNCNNNHSRDHLDKSHILLNNFASSMGVYKFNHCLDLVQYTTNSSTNNDIETNNAETSDSIIQSIDKQCELDLCEDGNRCKMLEKYFLNSNNNHTRDFLDKSKILLRNFASSMGLYKFNQNMDLIEYTEDLSRNNYMETNKEISTAEIVKLTSNPDDSSLSSILKYPVDRSKVDEVNISTSSYTSDTTTSVDQSASDSSSTTFSQEEDKTLYDQLHGGKLDNRIIELIICLRLYDIRQLTSGNTYTHYNSLFHRLAQDLGICPTDTRSIAELYRLLTYNVRKIRDKINKAICNSRNRFIRKIPVCFVKLPKFKFENPPRPTVFKKSMIKPNMLFKISSMHLCDNDVDLTTKFSAGKPILKVTSGLRQVTECISSSMQNIIKKTLVEDEELPSDLSIRVTVISDDDDDENVYIENKQKEFMDSLKKPDGSDNYDAKCPNCGYQGILTANHIIGPSCIKMAGILAASCIGLPFAWIPFTISRFKDSLYSCVNCKAILAISEKKFNKTKKLVWTFGLDEYLPTQYRDLNIRKKRPTFSSIGTEESFIDPTRSKSVKIVQLTNLM